MLPIVEKFRSLQGENFEAGTPSIFIRVGGCTLACPWCDSKYASKSNFKAKFELNTSQEVSAFVRLVATAPRGEIPVNHAVITGGEPMMEEYIPYVQQIIFELWNNYHIDTTIETTTCMAPDDIGNKNRSMLNNIENFLVSFIDKYGIDEIPNFIKFSVSPKFHKNCYKVHLNIINNNSIIDFYRLDKTCLQLGKVSILNLIYLKMIYKDDIYIEGCINSIVREWPASLVDTHICLMPYTPMHPSEYNGSNGDEGMTFREAYNKSCRETADFCKRQNLHYSPRLHIDLWGLKRGV